jgi:hypothetical protein
MTKRFTTSRVLIAASAVSLLAVPASSTAAHHASHIVASFGNGRWSVTASGKVFASNGAPFYGDIATDGIRSLNAPIVGGASTPGGHGYWLVAADGGVFNFGSAHFYGSAYSLGLTGLSGQHPLSAPIVGMAASGSGYLLLAADGGVFNLGGAHFYGSAYSVGYTGLGGANPLPAPAVSIELNPGGPGYYIRCANGAIIAIGVASSTNMAAVRQSMTPDISTNWAGNIESGTQFTGVSGTFNVAQLTPGQTSGEVTEWVGIGGLHGQSILQAGVTVMAGSNAVFPWIETYPQMPVNLDQISISPGDDVNVSIEQVGNSWLVSLSDLTTKQSYTESVNYSGTTSSAEWIVEAATPTLASYQPIHFSNLHYQGNASTQVNMIMYQKSVAQPIANGGFTVQQSTS